VSDIFIINRSNFLLLLSFTIRKKQKKFSYFIPNLIYVNLINHILRKGSTNRVLLNHITPSL